LAPLELIHEDYGFGNLFHGRIQLMTAVTSGVNVTINAGTAGKCSAASYELLLLHSEIVRTADRIRRGMTVNEETMAVEPLKEIGIRGEYMVHPHTLKWIREKDEFIHKDLLDATGFRCDYSDPCVRANERWRQILAEHECQVSESDRAAIDNVAAKYLK